jgi:RNA 2',3'-cyclic 3'-phosphodiesterase
MKRCFIAIKIPLDNSILKFLEFLKREFISSRISWVKPENMHLTLAFLGEISDQDIRETEEILEEASSKFSRIDFEIKGFGTFGNSQNPGVLWLGLNFTATLEKLKLKLDEDLKTIGYMPDDRPFQPHLTLGRIKFFNSKTQLVKIQSSYRETPFLKFSADKIILFESKLSSIGPEYFVIKDFPLQP